MPKYEEIANILRDRIANGVYPVDSMLPIQSELSKEFGVSRMTIKKAVEILTIEGLIFSKQGNGTRVLNSSFWDKEDSKFRLNNYNGLSQDFKNDDRKLTSQIIQFAVEFPEAEIAERLQVEVTTPVYKIIRLRLIDEKPYVLEHTYMPCDLVPGLDESILLQSIYAYLWDELNLKFAGSYHHITAEKPDEYDKMYLDCQNADPLLQVEQVVYLENGRPIEYSRSRNRFDTRGYSLLDVKNI
ncbi:GntR family transcriptional regulator [Streptococcus sp. HMSC034E12]|uniref:GntR family transcriptional regulator n=1 Tax=Streptococcus sp. HMSC034E12 TaxID=1715053 RepID=UPI0008AA5076|nr:GntR family transcriptional regulator [Streptococcus sp. HMSC034E12]MCW1090091.1 GntR family transcriptional regulator [Streptococcus anginosus]OHO36582.1 GntR family transcriptional regulator [Streptococcus sp. HMSC034E12]